MYFVIPINLKYSPSEVSLTLRFGGQGTERDEEDDEVHMVGCKSIVDKGLRVLVAVVLLSIL